MGVAVQKAGVSENKNVQADIQFMTHDHSPATLEALNYVNSSIIGQRANSTVENTKLCSRSDVSTQRKTLPLEFVPLQVIKAYAGARV
jgi:hypothetical protein